MQAWWARPAERWGPGERLLACGAAAVADLRAAVWEELGYSCSAGAGRSCPLGVTQQSRERHVHRIGLVL